MYLLVFSHHVTKTETGSATMQTGTPARVPHRRYMKFPLMRIDLMASVTNVDHQSGTGIASCAVSDCATCHASLQRRTSLTIVLNASC